MTDSPPSSVSLPLLSLTVPSPIVNCPSFLLHISFPILRVRMWLGTVRLWKGDEVMCRSTYSCRWDYSLWDTRYCWENIVWSELLLFIVIFNWNKTTNTFVQQQRLFCYKKSGGMGSGKAGISEEGEIEVCTWSHSNYTQTYVARPAINILENGVDFQFPIASLRSSSRKVEEIQWDLSQSLSFPTWTTECRVVVATISFEFSLKVTDHWRESRGMANSHFLHKNS